MCSLGGRLRYDLAICRLAFGQPRQEDLLVLVAHRAAGGPATVPPSLALDLGPVPPSPASDG